MSCYPWIVFHERQNLNDFPHLKQWYSIIQSRPAVQRAYDEGQRISVSQTLSEEAKNIIFNQAVK